MYAARNEKGDIVGFALWLPPGHNLFNAYVKFSVLQHAHLKDQKRPEQCELGFNDFVGRLSDAGKRYCTETVCCVGIKTLSSVLNANTAWKRIPKVYQRKYWYSGCAYSTMRRVLFPTVVFEQAEENCYWCSMAMVRKDYQGQGICRTLFRLADEEVSDLRRGSSIKHANSFCQASKTGTTVAFTTTDETNVNHPP